MSPPARSSASVGVIGGGIFGVTAAWELAAAGLAVTLYEQRDDILSGTTSRNFFRVHRGYHYPRDLPTARDARDGFDSFSQTFSAAFTAPVPHHYAIAVADSLTTVEQFERHCRQLGLRARRALLPELVPGSVAACFEVDEAYYDTTLLRKLAWERLLSAQVRVELQSACAARDIARAHEFVVVAAYGSLNEILPELGCAPIELQYELCEVPIVRTPDLDGLSLVVLDGPFVSIAPYGSNGHALYDVVHSVHARSVGQTNPGFREYPQDFAATRALPPRLSRFAPILASTRRFLALLENAVHVCSHFAERVVIPGLDATDARPTVVQWASPRVIFILSGKVSTSIDTARLVAREIASR
jgi:glycine/D-amino acid oxidase-like deaminating enzyme